MAQDVKDKIAVIKEKWERYQREMNFKSRDARYNELIDTLNVSLMTLAAKIVPKVYEYVFLKK
jgi:hypothetical protein